MKEKTIERIRKFTEERDWDQFHSPANLAKSIVIEAAELLECFQWSDTEYDLQHIKEELADVLVYSQNLLDKLELDADEIVNMKMKQNDGYNILLLSNIYDYIDAGVDEYCEYILKYGADEALVRYCWCVEQSFDKFIKNLLIHQEDKLLKIRENILKNVFYMPSSNSYEIILNYLNLIISK